MLRDDEEVQDEVRRAAERAWLADEICATDLAHKLDRLERAATAERDDAYNAAAGQRERVGEVHPGLGEHQQKEGNDRVEHDARQRGPNRTNTMSHENPFRCPTCGAPQKLRYQRGGGGDKFWGCSTFPSCKGTSRWRGPDMDSEIRCRRELNEAERIFRGD